MPRLSTSLTAAPKTILAKAIACRTLAHALLQPGNSYSTGQMTPNLTPMTVTPAATIPQVFAHFQKQQEKKERKGNSTIFQNETMERQHESITRHPSRPQVLHHQTRNCQQSSSRHPTRYPRRLRPQHLCWHTLQRTP